MANTIIQIKRSSTTTVPTTGTLSASEPAYSYLSEKLFLGTSDGSGVIAIGGKFYVDLSNTIFNAANAAFLTANVGFTSANLIFDAANAAFLNSNVGFNAANAAFLNSNVGFNAANSAYITANSAFDDSNTRLSTSGGTVTGDVSIVGDLVISGNTYVVDSETLRVSDPLIYLAGNNYVSDIVDIGFVANYANATGQNVHTGVFRDHSTKEYYIFQGYSEEPINNHIDPNGNNFTLAVLNADIRTTNLILSGTNTTIWIRSAYDAANAGFTQANTSEDIAIAAYAQANAASLISAAGNDTEIQFNNSGNFGANSGLTFDSGLGRLNVGNVGITSQTVFFGNSGLSFSNGSSNAVFVSASGNVGIGTTTPSDKLHVEGTVKVTGDSIISSYKFNSSQITDSAYFILNRSPSGLRLGEGYPIYWSTSIGNVSNPVKLFGGRISGLLEQKNSTNPQNFSIYGTYTDSLNYERLSLSSNSTASYIQTENVGTGTARPLRLGANNSTAVTIATNGDVGIGTTNPFVAGGGYRALTIDGPVSGFLTLRANGTRYGQLYFDTNEFRMFSDTYPITFMPGGTEKVRFAADGNVGIGTTTPAEKLDVAGNIQSSNTVFAVHFDNVSDITLKENISSLNNTIDTLNKLNPVSFDWKDSKTKSYGLIAQEVEQILPTIVHSKPDGTKTVNYIEIIAFLIAAVKDLQRQIDDINKK